MSWTALATAEPDDFDFTQQDHALLLKVCVSVNKARFGGRRDYRDFLGAAWRGWREAKAKFDTERGTRFSTFAIPFIRGRIMDEIRQEMPYSRATYRLLRQYHELIDAGFSRSIAVDEVTNGLNKASRFAFLSALLDSDQRTVQDGEESYDETMSLPDTSIPDLVEQLNAKATHETIRNLINTKLEWMERQVVSRVYDDGMKMKEIGVLMEISESRVSQIASRGLTKLRNILSQTAIIGTIIALAYSTMSNVNVIGL